MANKVNLDAFEILTYQGRKTPAWVVAVPTVSFTNLDGQYIVGGDFESGDKEAYQKAAVTGNGNGKYTAAAFSGSNALSATVWDGTEKSAYNFYLTDANFRLLETLYTNVSIYDSDVTVTVQDFARQIAAPRFLRLPSYMTREESVRMYNALVNLATKASPVVLGGVKIDVTPDNVNEPIAVGVNSPLLDSTATALAKGGTRLSKAPVDADIPIAVGANEFSFTAATQVKYLEEYGTLAAAQAAIGSATPTVLRISQPYALEGSQELTSNILLDITGNGFITVPPNKILKIGAFAEPGNRQVFSTGADIRFGYGAVNEVRAVWFTGAGETLSADTAISTTLFAAQTSGGGTVKFGSGTFENEGSAVPYSGTTIEGSATALDDGGFGTSFELQSGSPQFIIGEDTKNITFRNFKIDGGGIPVATGILAEGSAPNTSWGTAVDRVTFVALDKGFYLHSLAGGWQLAQTVMNAPQFINCNTAIEAGSINSGFLINAPYAIIAANGKFYHATGDGAGITTIISDDLGGNDSGETAFLIDADHLPINLIGGQDEKLAHFLVVNAGQITSPINHMGRLIQSETVLNASHVLNYTGVQMGAESIRDVAGVAAQVNIHGCTFQRHPNTEKLALTLEFVGNPPNRIIESVSYGAARSVTFTVNAATDIFTSTAHGFETGSRVSPTSTGTLPGGMFPSRNYWVIKINANTYKLADTLADAANNIPIPIGNAGTGTHTLTLPEARFEKFEGDSVINETGSAHTRTDRISNYVRHWMQTAFAGTPNRPFYDLASGEANKRLIGFSLLDGAGQTVLKSYGILVDSATYNLKFTGDDDTKGYDFDADVNVAGNIAATGNLSGDDAALTGNILASGTLTVGGSAMFGDDVEAESLTVNGGAAFGSVAINSGTAITKKVLYSPTLTPASVAANTSAEQTFTVAGLTTADKVTINIPGLTAGTGIVGARVSAANTLAISFANFTATPATPASGIYKIMAERT